MLALFLLTMLLLVIVIEPWPLLKWRMLPEFRFKVPALVIELVPASSSMVPATLTVPPLRMLSVRPAKTLPTPVPEKVRSAPLATTTELPPVQVPAVPPQVLPVPVRVKAPEPPNVPPVWVNVPATLVAPFSVKLPPVSESPPPNVLALVTVSPPPLTCRFRPETVLMLLMV